MLCAAYGTVEDIEILWVVLAALGGLYSLLNFSEARKDWQEIQKKGIHNGRRAVGWMSYWSEMIRIVIQTIFLLVGVMAIMLPNPPSNVDLPWQQQAAGIFVRWGLIVSSALLTVKSYLARRARKEVEQEH